MNKFIISFFIIALTILFIYFGFFMVQEVSQNTNFQEVSVGNKLYKLEVAQTYQDLERGLAKFDDIKDNEGMLFIFEEPGRWTIWMKDMKFNIDIIFLNENKEVVTIYENVKFENHENVFAYRKYQPEYDSKYVIELKEGQVAENKVKIGDKIEF